MEQRFGIFMPIGDNVTYGQLSGTCMVKMNITDFSSVAEAVRSINETNAIPSNTTYYILPFYQYTKPTPLA